MQVSVVLRESVLTTDQLYDYLVPTNMEDCIMIGQFVVVPFGKGNRSEIALVLDLFPDRERQYSLKSILSIVDIIPVILRQQIALLSYMRARYSCTYGDAIRLMVPAVVSDRKGKGMRRCAYLLDPDKAKSLLAEGEVDSLPQIRIMELLLECEFASISEIMSSLSVSRSPIETLKKKGIIGFESIKQEDKDVPEDVIADTDVRVDPFPPTDAQREAIDVITRADKKKEILLFGVTGSGKTEVYLQCAQKILDNGDCVLFLVPEISLTPQMIRWISERFPGKTAVLHSRLSQKERYDQWDKIRQGKAQIVIGARSAIFAPINRLKLIIMDEEQDTSYKSETHPRYHTRDMARFLAKNLDAVFLLGSATPSIETYFAAKSGYITLLNLPERVNESSLPKTQIIDMREELKMKNRSIFGMPLRQAMETALAHDEQIILFLNRRGYSSMMLCRACGSVISCPHCSVSMTLHARKKDRPAMLVCHYCGKVMRPPQNCPSCNSTLQGRFGMGTQQLEEYVKAEFPGVLVIRMDQDTTSGKNAHATLLSAFREKKASILVGTQMIAKGHDFPDVTVVGIVSADLLLRASDFRASERAFQLITQASGRAGRGDKKGQVFIQTYDPDDDVLICAAMQDYERFYQNEIEYRRRLKYPPFRAFGSVLLSHEEDETAYKQANFVLAALKEYAGNMENPSGVEFFGPAPAQTFRLRDRCRYRINVKAMKKSDLSYLFSSIRNRFYKDDYLLYMDIDPLW